MKKLLLSSALLAAVCTVNAQFRMDKDYPTAGIKVITDSVNAKRSIIIDFNTNKALTVIGEAAQKATTQRGVQIKVYNELGVEVSPQDSRANNYGANGNPIHISDVPTILDFYTAKDVPAWSTSHNFWKPANCVFDVDPTDLTNQALGAYPGIYKRIDYRFYFNFGGSVLSSDLEFDIKTFDAGNSGKTAAYKLMVSLGSDKTSISESDEKMPDYVIPDFYVTGSGDKHVNLADALGLQPSDFTNKKVYIALYTDGTGTAIQPGVYDPVIVFDNFTANLDLASWVIPAGGIGVSNPIEGESIKNVSINDNELIFPLNLKMNNRIGDLTVTNDIDSDAHGGKKFSFLTEAGVMAKDTEGKYTIPVAYTYTPDVFDGEKWSKEKIVVATTGVVSNDDICVFLKYIKKDGDVDGKTLTEKFEMDCGSRIWFNYKGEIDLNPNSIVPQGVANELKVYSKSGKIVVENAANVLHIYNMSGQMLQTVTPEHASTGVKIEPGVYLVGEKNKTVQKILVN